MRVGFLWALFLLPITASSQAPDGSSFLISDPQPRVLSPASHIKLDIPMFGATGNIPCDGDGNVIFNVGTGIGQKGPFWGVESDGKKHVVYNLPQEASGRGEIAWSLTPGGTFYVLFQNFKDYKLFRFKTDGSVDGTLSLNVPPGVLVLNLAIQDNETMYLGGYQDTAEPRSKPRTGYAALFDATGRMIRDLSVDAPKTDLTAITQHPLDGDAVAGEDGRFYVLRATDVQILSQSGEVIHEWPFKKPVPDAVASRVDYSKGAVSILFYIPHPKGEHLVEVETRAMLLDAQTGEKRRDYIFDPSTTGSVVCYNAQTGYTLMAIDGKSAAFDLVPVR